MVSFLLFIILLVLVGPIAFLTLLLYPLIWLLLLPFRLIGLMFEGVFEFLRAVIMLPARLLGGKRT